MEFLNLILSLWQILKLHFLHHKGRGAQVKSRRDDASSPSAVLLCIHLRFYLCKSLMVFTVRIAIPNAGIKSAASRLRVAKQVMRRMTLLSSGLLILEACALVCLTSVGTKCSSLGTFNRFDYLHFWRLGF